VTAEFPTKNPPNTPPEYYCCRNLLGPEFILFKFQDEIHLFWLEHPTGTYILSHSPAVIYIISNDMIFFLVNIVHFFKFFLLCSILI